MDSTATHPALTAFVARVSPEFVFGEVRVTRSGPGFELRHASEPGGAVLETIPLSQLRSLAAVTASGQFRPIKAAPTLRSGWRCFAAIPAELDAALRQLYPGGLADWFAAAHTPGVAVSYREFTGRQTGMYRITTMLTDDQVAAVARAGCHRRFCLKRRLWAVDGLGAEGPAEKSELVCLEPCAVLMELARAIARAEQRGGELPPAGEPPEREADFSNGANPRFSQWCLENGRPSPVSIHA